jgi:hypothetical protein
MVNPIRFYTYAYLRVDRTPYYIGKGQKNRVYRKRKGGINPPKDKSRIIFLKQNLKEEEAFKHEIYMIAVFGRKDLGTGILHNRTNGGEGPSGMVHSEETRDKISKANKGKYHSEETKRKMSEVNKGENNPSYGKKGKNSPLYGRKHTKETRRKQSEKMKGENNPNYGKSPSEETRKKLSKSREGENNHMYGKSHSEETRRKQSEKMKGKSPSEEIRRNQSETMKGRKWWNDGFGNSKFSLECPGEGWVFGRGKIKKTS